MESFALEEVFVSAAALVCTGLVVSQNGDEPIVVNLNLETTCLQVELIFVN